MCSGKCSVKAGALGGRKGESDSLELELKVLVRMWGLVTKLGFSARAEHTPLTLGYLLQLSFCDY